MNYFKQIWYEMRHQKMMTWVSISGTALSIFLVMAFFIAEQTRTVGVAPETNRHRILSGHNIHLKSIDSENRIERAGGISYEGARKLYSGLKGIEMESYMTAWPESYNAGLPGKRTESVNGRATDANFWKLYDFRFLYGKPYDAESCEAGEKKVVITRNLARRFFKEDNAVGKELMLQHVPYVVCGVVEDVSPLLATTGNDLFLPLGPALRSSDGNHGLMGNIQAQLLLEEGADPSDVRRQVEARYATLNASLKKEMQEAVYHGQPYDAEVVSTGGYGSNNTPDNSAKKRMSYIVYSVLLILPAINLANMTRSRLRRRVSEIGVRRAFGAPRLSIVGQILGENFIITVIGGAIGMALSFLFMFLLYDLFFATASASMLEGSPAPSVEMMFTWHVFAIALVFCFFLNLLSAFVPAWRASRVAPALAIAKAR